MRRRIDMARGNMRIPEHKLNEIRRDNGKDQKMVAMFFNSIFLSIDNQIVDEYGENPAYQIPDKSEPYNIQLMNIYLVGLLKKHLNDKEFEVLRLSYGLDCEKHSAKEIAQHLNITDTIDYVTISSTGNATDFGDLSAAQQNMAATSDSITAVSIGGEGSRTATVIDFVTIASTGNAADFGDQLTSAQELAACSDSHGGIAA